MTVAHEYSAISRKKGFCVRLTGRGGGGCHLCVVCLNLAGGNFAELTQLQEKVGWAR